jgi:hypothetical protein
MSWSCNRRMAGWLSQALHGFTGNSTVRSPFDVAACERFCQHRASTAVQGKVPGTAEQVHSTRTIRQCLMVVTAVMPGKKCHSSARPRHTIMSGVKQHSTATFKGAAIARSPKCACDALWLHGSGVRLAVCSQISHSLVWLLRLSCRLTARPDQSHCRSRRRDRALPIQIRILASMSDEYFMSCANHAARLQCKAGWTAEH